MDFSGTVVNEETTENIPNMVINQASLGTGSIDVSINDNFGLALESNINGSNEFDAEEDGRIKAAHTIMLVGTYVYEKALPISMKRCRRGGE